VCKQKSTSDPTTSASDPYLCLWGITLPTTRSLPAQNTQCGSSHYRLSTNSYYAV